MRILLTVHQYVPDFFAGTEVLTHSVARELVRRGHEVTVLTGYPGNLDDMRPCPRFREYVLDGVSVLQYPHARNLNVWQQGAVRDEYHSDLLATMFKTVLDDVRPDCVHFFHLGRLSASVIDVCKSLGLPMVATLTDYWFICPTAQLRLPDNSICSGPDKYGANCLRHIVGKAIKGKLGEAMQAIPGSLLSNAICLSGLSMFRVLPAIDNVAALAERQEYLRNAFAAVDRVLVPTRHMWNLLQQNGFDLSQSALSAFGIELTSDVQPSNHALHKAKIIGFVGSLSEHKGPQHLIRAFLSLPGADLQLHIYGRLDEFPMQAAYLKTLAAGDARIRFMGTFAPDSSLDVMSTLDVLVVPSVWHENTPLVIYLAQAVGCPVIGSHVGGIAEVIEHEVNGLLFPAGNEEALSNALSRVVNEDGLLQQLSSKARPPKSVAKYIDEIEENYRSLVDLKR